MLQMLQISSRNINVKKMDGWMDNETLFKLYKGVH